MMTGRREDGKTGRMALLFGLLLPVIPSSRHPGLSAQCPDGTPPPCRGARAAAAPPANSVAVLYFDNRSRDSNDAYLAEGLTEAIIAKLGDLPRLTVKSRFLVRRFRGGDAEPGTVARSLGVTYLVTGSVQRAGNRLRVTAEMALGDAPRALDILDRIPRGALAWSICGLGNIRPEVIQQFPDSRLRRIVEENRPPWVGP